MKKLLFAFSFLLNILASGQTPNGLVNANINVVDTTYDWRYITGPLTNVKTMESKRMEYVSFYHDQLRLPAYSGFGTRVAGLDIFGNVYSLPQYSLIDTTKLATKFYVNSAGSGLYYPLSGNPSNFITQSAGDTRYAMIADTFPVGNIMTTRGANAAINTLNSGKQNLVSLTTTGTGAATFNQSTGALNIPTPASVSRSFNNSPGRSLTTGAGATGFQTSSTRDAIVNYSVSISTTVSLSGNSSGIVVFEICPTNSSTPGDWIEIGRTASGQSGTLVIGLVLNQVGGGQIGGVVPAGYYSKIRTINTSGTPTFVINSQQEVLL